MKTERRIAVWRAPIGLAVLTMSGLLAALIGSDGWRWPACIALAIPVLLGAWHGLRHQSADD